MPRQRADRILVWSLRATSALAGLLVLMILGFLVFESLDGVRRVGAPRFLSDPGWHPNQGDGSSEFSLLPMIVATLTTTLGAILLAGPIGILAAVYCRFYASERVSKLFRRLIELLAGIPSVVYGFWGLVTLVPLIREIAPPGASLAAGVLVLFLMIVPTVALLAFAALKDVPKQHLEGAAALSLSRWSTLRQVVFPSAASGLGIALLLGTMRALGETMAVLMVCGNIARVPESLFDPVRTLTANIALELGYATADHRSVLFVSGLALMIMVVGLVVVQGRLQRRASLG